ncbi:MAG: hypothetical protein AAFQ98_15160 [Bacteroidota bacterium]
MTEAIIKEKIISTIQSIEDMERLNHILKFLQESSEDDSPPIEHPVISEFLKASYQEYEEGKLIPHEQVMGHLKK